MATLNKMTREQLIEIVKKVPAKAGAENWVLTLDRDEGTLFYSPVNIPAGTELFQVTDEYSIYVDKGLAPHGVMIEYYNFNFIEHHPEFKIMTPKVFADERKEVETVSVRGKRTEETTIFKALLEKTLIAEAVAGHLPS